MRHLLGEMLRDKLEQNETARGLLPELERDVTLHKITPFAAARRLIECL